MRIWIDADACPKDVKELVFRASARLSLPVCLVANRTLAGIQTTAHVTAMAEVDAEPALTHARARMAREAAHVHLVDNRLR